MSWGYLCRMLGQSKCEEFRAALGNKYRWESDPVYVPQLQSGCLGTRGCLRKEVHSCHHAYALTLRVQVPDNNTRCPSSTLLPFFFWFPLLKPNSRKKGTLIIMGLLEYDLPDGNYIATITILNPTT